LKASHEASRALPRASAEARREHHDFVAPGNPTSNGPAPKEPLTLFTSIADAPGDTVKIVSKAMP
jgi:hypothetical protein